MQSLRPVIVLFYLSFPSISWSFGTTSPQRVFVSTPVSDLPKRSAEDCMSRASCCLHSRLSVDEAIGYLLQSGESGAPVVDDGMIVGMVTAFDFLQKEAFEGSLLPMQGSAAKVGMYVDAAKKICGQTVADIMTPDPVTIHRTTGMREAAAKMTELRVQRLPVVDDDGRLLGVLTSKDVMRDLHRVVQNLPPSQESKEASP